jgi:hypothetical protein
MPKALLESRMTMLEKTTWRVSAWVSVPINRGVEELERMQLVTTTFSVGLTGPVGLWLSEVVLRQMESSPVTISESEMMTLEVETRSMPSPLTAFSREV